MKMMMNKLCVTLAALLFSGLVAAQGKVVVFNMQAAIMQTDAAQKQVRALEANSDYAALRARFESLRSDMQSLEKDAQNNGMTWSDEQRASHRKKVEYTNADLKLAAEKLKAERDAAVKQILQGQVERAQTVLNEVVTAEGVGLVLDSSVAYWANDSHDITAEVTAKLNKAK